MFYLIGSSSQKAGITVTTLANKLSLVFPVLFSLIYFKEQISVIKYIGLITATIAVLLTVYKKDVKKTRLIFIILPVLIFFGSGLVDSMVKYVQAVKISESDVTDYTIVVFLVAFLCGVIITLFRKNKKDIIYPPTLILGFLLGAANFGSLYFIIRALNNSNLESSLVFALNNMSIVALTALLGTLLFKEKLNIINFAGILLGIISIYFLL
jgi:drug/metabolite transporter (DMT)-like permease